MHIKNFPLALDYAPAAAHVPMRTISVPRPSYRKDIIAAFHRALAKLPPVNTHGTD